MRKRFNSGLLATVGLAGFLALAPQTGMAKEGGADDRDLIAISSFSGAFLAARAAEADNDFESAIDYYERALAFEPDNQGIQQSLLLALVAEGRFDDALPHARALKSVPEMERFSRLGLAVDALRKEKYAQAENWLKLVLESDLDRLITSIMSTWTELGQGRADEALKTLGDLEGPDWYRLFQSYHRALMLAQSGRDAEAEKAFDALLGDVSAASAGPDTYMRAAEAYAAWLVGRGEKDKALAALEKGETYITGRAATTILREKIEADEPVAFPVPDPRAGAAEILLNIATALNRGGGEPFVKLYLNYALALSPDNDDILIQLASLAEQQSEPEKAIGFYDRIKPGSPWRRLAELQTGLNLADLDRHDEAETYLNAAIEKDPDDIRAYLSLGRVYAVQKDFRSAAGVYDRAVARIKEPEREDWSLFYQRGIAYERLKEWEKAEPNFFKALELYPDQPQVLNYLGYSWVDMNIKLEEGLELIGRAVELRPNDGYIVDSLGWAHYRLGRYEEAAKELERAVSLRPEDPVLNDHLGDAYWRTGRRLEATYQWSHARDLDPEPELLAEVEKKLKEGLPDKEAKRVAEVSSPETVISDETGVSEATPSGETDEPKSEAKAPDAAEKAAMGDAMYTIKPGETLWSIAVEQLGDGERFREILAINPDLRRNPDLLRAGQEIRLPE
ncbi:tetratricopeptide repeat protein [Nitratireductor sp. L1-7-SE]|uniref:Tetratricopeptide repeat protein n=1 Tax=Nitratireductor rhodophyticola TaxID=2854036 RepID=A0ABS7RB85_9HYPH|nr:tetratricopeptide repeat protein [Nitratireductor rhodophyticola]MBY8918211.1 tetratricopeptide repeat protein [Nitratireductor rhodophyticola]MBY8920980.1 tetratricopeptide repeat protein [Nitratireductor rhodophyticola]